MTDNNQAYVKKCGDCHKTADRLYFTKVQDGSRKVYRMLCPECSANHKE